jgi:hypothetical protein
MRKVMKKKSYDTVSISRFFYQLKHVLQNPEEEQLEGETEHVRKVAAPLLPAAPHLSGSSLSAH